MIFQMKRPYDDDISSLSYTSDLFSDQLTPPTDAKRFKDTVSAIPPDYAQPLSTQKSLSSPPPSPSVSQQTTGRRRQKEIAAEDSNDVEEYRLRDKPPHGISPDEYHTAIPPHLSPQEQVTQLMIWSAQEAAQRGTGKAQSLEERRADRIAAGIQAQLIQGLREGSIVTSWYTPPPGTSTATTTKKTPNPRNEANRRRVQEFKQVLKSLDEEEQEWRDVTTQLFAEHAAMLDASAKDKGPIPITLDMFDALDDKQRQFVETYCQDDNESLIQERIDFEDMATEITDLRQKLSVIDHFQRGAERYCKDTMRTIARAMERETCIPSELAKATHIVDQDRAVQEAKKDTAGSVLQALANLHNNKP
ncbi:Mis12-Mtw1 protein family-domain-containing protein [Fennellomyces sp. T-0311]|nr:Mis12-Mtw1 protein family-domain-containing protein [Fennellomyces sp. T-0311]